MWIFIKANNKTVISIETCENEYFKNIISLLSNVHGIKPLTYCFKKKELVQSKTLKELGIKDMDTIDIVVQESSLSSSFSSDKKNFISKSTKYPSSNLREEDFAPESIIPSKVIQISPDFDNEQSNISNSEQSPESIIKEFTIQGFNEKDSIAALSQCHNDKTMALSLLLNGFTTDE